VRRPVLLVTAVTVAVACALGTTGCGQAGPEASPSGTASSETARPVASPVPDGYRYVNAPASGVRVAVPDDWSAVVLDQVASDPGTRAQLADMASRINMTVDQVLELGADVLMVSADGALDVSVLKPMPGTLTEGQLTAMVRSTAGATDVTTRQVTTAVGDAVVTDYSSGRLGGTMHLAQVYQQIGPSFTMITVGGTDAAQTRRIADVIVGTIDTIS